MTDTRQLIFEATNAIEDAVNSLSPEAMRGLDQQLGEGARIELRIAIQDDLPSVSIVVGQLGGEMKEIARLDVDGN